MNLSPTTEPVLEEPSDALFRHKTRDTWGLGVEVGRDDRFAQYQFEDGQLRKIAYSFRHLLVEVDRPADEAERLRSELYRQAGLTKARKKRRNETDRPLIRFDQQVQLFTADYPEGFQGKAWTKRMRGEGAKRTLKRHRDPIIEKGQELFGKTELASLLMNQRYNTVIERMIELIGSTTIGSKRDLDTLKKLKERDHQRVASSLGDLLYGDGELAARMDRFIMALTGAGKGVSWTLATSIPAIVLPEEHVVLRNSVASEQARWMAPRVTVRSTPSGKQYVRLLKMMKTVRDELAERGFEVHDLIDVSDFVWETLRPAARKRIAELPPLDKDEIAIKPTSTEEEDAAAQAA